MRLIDQEGYLENCLGLRAFCVSKGIEKTADRSPHRCEVSGTHSESEKDKLTAFKYETPSIGKLGVVRDRRSMVSSCRAALSLAFVIAG